MLMYNPILQDGYGVQQYTQTVGHEALTWWNTYFHRETLGSTVLHLFIYLEFISEYWKG